MFGVPISLFYHEDQKVRKSYFGATMTLLLWLIALWFISIQLLKIRDPGHQTIQQIEYNMNLTENEPIDLNKSHTKFYAVLWHNGASI